MRKNLFATTPGIIIVGAVIGLIAVWPVSYTHLTLPTILRV